MMSSIRISSASSSSSLLLSLSWKLIIPLQRRFLATTAVSSLSSWKVDPSTGAVWNTSSSQNSNSNGNSNSNNTPEYQVIVGLEIHAQLQIPTKLFSPAKASSSSSSTTLTPVNQNIHPFDLAVPGKLPVLSKAAVQKAVLAAAALQCHIPLTSRFERKHYAYADLPASYQITQQRWPLAVNGIVVCEHKLNTSSRNNSSNNSGSSSKRKKNTTNTAAATTTSTPIRCRVERIQLEQDTGKTTTTTKVTADHDDNNDDENSTTTTTTTISRVDFNRAGIALIEIVLQPDLRSSLEAVAVVQTIRQLLQYTETCEGKMEEGQLRVDCNINLQKRSQQQQQGQQQQDGNQNKGATAATTATIRNKSPRVEVKNLNSLRQVQDAVEYEARRQAAQWDELTLEETRTWNVAKGKTELIRIKDTAVDYRFMPEPDLPPLVLDGHVLDGMTRDEFIAQNLPELPTAAIERLKRDYGLSDYLARVIAGDPPAIRLFDMAMAISSLKKESHRDIVANLLCNELFALVKEHADDEHDASIKHSTVTGEQLGELANLVVDERISSTMAKKLLNLLFTQEHGKSPQQVAADRGFQLITDPNQLRELCRQVINEHPEELEVYKRGGKFVTKMHKLFTGKAMAASKGNAHPERLREALLEVLEEF